MRKFWGTWGLFSVAGFAIWMMMRRVPVTIINGVPQAPPRNVDPSNIVLVIAMVGVLALLGAWYRERRLSRNTESRDQLSASVDDRLARMEQTLDAVALEVERIGEMERFATKLLAQRQGEMEPRVSTSPPRVITPH